MFPPEIPERFGSGVDAELDPGSAIVEAGGDDGASVVQDGRNGDRLPRVGGFGETVAAVYLDVGFRGGIVGKNKETTYLTGWSKRKSSPLKEWDGTPLY